MACSAKVSLLVSVVLLSCVAFTSSRLVTFEGNEVNADKPYVEEVVIQSGAVHVSDKDVRRGRNKSQEVLADGASTVPKRKTRSLPYDNQGYPNQLGMGQQPGYQQLNPYPLPHPISIGTSLANSQASLHETDTPYGTIGSSITGVQSQGFTANQNGIQGSSSIGGNQEYKLPFGLTLSVAYADGYSVNNNDISRAGSNSVVLRGPDGQPIFSNYN